MIQDQAYRRAIIKYGIGFGISLVLSLVSYSLVVILDQSGMAIMVALGVLALTQLTVQLIFFLHLSDEKKPRWKTLSFLFMGLILAIIVVGSIWIMYHLNYNMMDFSPDEKTRYMLEQSGSGF